MTARVYQFCPDDATSSTSRSHPKEALENLAVKLAQWILTCDEFCSVHQLTRISASNGRNRTGGSPFTSPQKLRSLAHTVYLLNTIHRLVAMDRQVNQRELFYRSLSDPFSPCFGEQTCMNRALIALMDAVECDRHELGVFTTARGLVAADPNQSTLCLDHDGEFVANLSDHPDGLSISDQLVAISTLQTSATCVLIVEKDTVFQSLVRSAGFFEQVPCILVTARGYPDNITIRFLQQLLGMSNRVDMPFYYLGDLDPHGVSIAMVYHRALQGNLEWIGIHCSDISALNHQSMLGMKMKPSDQALLNGLLENPSTPDHVKDELARLESLGLKYEVECLHSVGEDFLANHWLPAKLATVSSTSQTTLELTTVSPTPNLYSYNLN